MQKLIGMRRIVAADMQNDPQNDKSWGKLDSVDNWKRLVEKTDTWNTSNETVTQPEAKHGAQGSLTSESQQKWEGQTVLELGRSRHGRDLTLVCELWSSNNCC